MAKDLMGRTFGRLRALERDGKFHHCLCACGKRVRVRNDRLQSGKTRSCGCLRAQMRADERRERQERLAAKRAVREAERAAKRPSALEKRLLTILNAMQQRCENPKFRDYPYYGGRGVRICERWRASRRAFLDDMAKDYRPGLWIERIDNSGDYTPENCVWMTPKRQSWNRRNTIFIDNVPLPEIVDRFELDYPRAYRIYSKLVVPASVGALILAYYA